MTSLPAPGRDAAARRRELEALVALELSDARVLAAMTQSWTSLLRRVRDTKRACGQLDASDRYDLLSCVENSPPVGLQWRMSSARIWELRSSAIWGE